MAILAAGGAAFALSSGAKPAPKPKPKPILSGARRYNVALPRIAQEIERIPGSGASASMTVALLAKVKAKFAEMSDEQKKKACELLKSNYPDRPEVQGLDCSKSTFQQVFAACGAVAGAAVCSITGAGAALAAVCGSLGAMIANYIGEDVEEWVTEAWDSVSSKAEELGENIENWISDTF